MGSAGGHGRRPLSVTLRKKLAPSFSRLHEPDPQRLVRTHKMIIRAPPLEMGQQMWRLLCCSPCSACQSCDPLSNGQIQPLDESGVQPS